MRNLSVLLVAGLGLFIVGCKPGGPNPGPFPMPNPNPTPMPMPTPNPTPNPIPNPIPNPNPNPTPMPMPNPNPMPPQNNAAGLAGTYHIDTEHFDMQVHGPNKSQEELQQIVAQLKQTFAAVSLTLNPDGTYQCSSGGQNSTGHYALNGSSLQLQEDTPSGNPMPQIQVAPDGSLKMHIETQGAGIDVTLNK